MDWAMGRGALVALGAHCAAKFVASCSVLVGVLVYADDTASDSLMVMPESLDADHVRAVL